MRHNHCRSPATARKCNCLAVSATVAVLVFGWLAAISGGASNQDAIPMKTTNLLIGKTPLPDSVPYLNRKESFFVGSGIAAGGGAADGSWDFLAGPDYTCPNYLANEQIKLVVDGTQQSVTMNVHRARNTGIFYGQANFGDLEVCLIDHAIRGEPWVARLVMIRNKSVAIAHQVRVQAWITPLIGPGIVPSV
jgi:hypothetical protein